MGLTLLDISSAGSGASFRKPKAGPESELVQWFLNRSPVSVPRGCHITIFKEPRLESGFPDLVVVQWREARTQDWHPKRLRLKAEDIRILHCLTHAGPASQCSLKALFGRDTTSRLERLLDADVVYFRSGIWKARPLQTTFAVQKIIAIEAKMEDIRGGFQQALLNTWFASLSYLLTPHVPRGEGVVNRAASLGVGLWSQERGVVHQPDAAPVPRSYASWLFNEWVWRARFSDKTQTQVPNEHRYSMAGKTIS